MAEKGIKFNFGAVKKKWRSEMRRADAKVARLNAKCEAVNGDLDVEEEVIDAAWDALEEATAKRDGLLGQVVEEVPYEWLIDDAPGSIKWGEPGAFDYVRPDRLQSLMDALMEAIQKPAGKS